MERLRTLTLVYTVVLVVALALSLIAIWIYLRRIGASLAKVQRALETARAETGPLGEHLGRLQEVSEASAEALENASQRLTSE